MFQSCSKLNNINVNFSVWDPESATAAWVKYIPSSGTFTCPADLPEEFDENKIPVRWNVVRK